MDTTRNLCAAHGCANGTKHDQTRYCYEHERTLLWNDPSIGIQWPLTGEPNLSEKDQNGVPLAETETYDELDV